MLLALMDTIEGTGHTLPTSGRDCATAVCELSNLHELLRAKEQYAIDPPRNGGKFFLKFEGKELFGGILPSKGAKKTTGGGDSDGGMNRIG
jgi:hypothetical protein